MKRFHPGVTGVFVACLSATFASAANPILVGDSTIKFSNPTATGGSLPQIEVDLDSRGLLKFDIQNVLPAGLPVSAIAQARLRLFVTRLSTQGSLRAAVTSTNWDETTVNNTTPFSAGISTTVTVSSPSTYVTLDVTQELKQAVTSQAPFLAFVLDSDGALYFDSKESVTTSQPPALEVTIAQQGPTGLTGMQGPPGATGSQGPQGPQGPAGPALLSGTAWVQLDNTAIPGTISEVSVRCPNAKPKVVNGACSIPATTLDSSFNATPSIVSIGPIQLYPNANDGWHCYMFNGSDNQPLTVTVQALCSN